MHQAARSKPFFAAIALLAVAALPVLSAPPAPPATRQGWHGETMPKGLERGKKEGEYVWKKDDTTMVYVPPGPFLMGNDKGEVAERPAHTVELDGFYIDKYETSWRKWKASGLPWLPGRDDRLQVVQAPDWGIHDGQPVVNVDWPEAKSYAAWAGKRLPTEAEWEKAARGTDGREYPWGNEPITNDRAIWEGHPISELSSAPVNCCESGASPYGALNMAGNVWEWCEDSYTPDFYASSPRKNPVNRHAGVVKIVRGGAMQLSPKFLRTYSRYWLSNVDRISDVGFRTVVSGVNAAQP
ncbi:MAG TPA: SUMF1/EgtB/PvdO family nonheme iron enzyme [Thermoanaerobaculia bacterium]|jgi:formylglycine-generating enzyme required for sulfatase activity|nr:SUMF1/EgtB/PvdO family nonheme iron enzyme [Thermoanaerobaculia bacterium]